MNKIEQSLPDQRRSRGAACVSCASCQQPISFDSLSTKSESFADRCALVAELWSRNTNVKDERKIATITGRVSMYPGLLIPVQEDLI